MAKHYPDHCPFMSSPEKRVQCMEHLCQLWDEGRAKCSLQLLQDLEVIYDRLAGIEQSVANIELQEMGK